MRTNQYDHITAEPRLQRPRPCYKNHGIILLYHLMVDRTVFFDYASGAIGIQNHMQVLVSVTCTIRRFDPTNSKQTFTVELLHIFHWLVAENDGPSYSTYTL